MRRIGVRQPMGASSQISRWVRLCVSTKARNSGLARHAVIAISRVFSRFMGPADQRRWSRPAMAAEVRFDMPQLGRFILENGVVFGAGSANFRAAGLDKGTAEGTKIDKVVQIGHNICIGRGCVLVAQTGVAVSSHLDGRVSVGARGGVAGHLTIGKGAEIAARCGAIRRIPASQQVAGAAAMPVMVYFPACCALAATA